jgi:hypothetical protein
MTKTSTLIYSIHNLGSMTSSELFDVSLLQELKELEKNTPLPEIKLRDVDQRVVNNIMKFAQSL